MSAVVIALLREQYPTITTAVASDAYLAAWLPWAQSLADVGRMGAAYEQALVLLLAHRAVVGDPGGLLGGSGLVGSPLRSVSTLQQSTSWAAHAAEGRASIDDAQFASTAPGRDWLTLRDSRPDVAIPWGWL